MEAVETVGVDVTNKYSIHINKCNAGEMDIVSVCAKQRADSVHLLRRRKWSATKTLTRKSQAQRVPKIFFLKTQPRSGTFVKRAPTLVLPENSSVRVDVTEFDELKSRLENEISSLRQQLDSSENQSNDRLYELLNNLVQGFGAGLASRAFGALGSVAAVME